MKVVGLFAGIGGIELGFRQAGHETALLCENDPAARAVLEKHFAGTQFHGSVTTLKDVPPDTDLLAAGFPCQDLSQAGRTGGIDGARSGLVSHVFRLLGKRAVPWVLIENVPFMLQLHRGAAMEYVVSRLERLGYRWAYRVVDSRAFGLPQRRRRVYLLASLEVDPGRFLFRRSVSEPETPSYEGRACGFYWTEGNRGLGWAVDAIPTLKGGSDLGIPSPPAIWLPDGRVVTPDIRDAERLQGFEADWTLPAAIVARATVRWRLVGNAVSVPVACWIAKSFQHGGAARRVEAGEFDGGPWPIAAFGSAAGRFRVDVTEWPDRAPCPPLADFLAYSVKPLSVRAAAGFASRLKKSPLWYPKELLEAFERRVDSASPTAYRDAADLTPNRA